MRGFVKVIAYNFLNHQQVIGFNTTSSSLASGAPLTNAWVRPAAYGTISSSNFGTPRQFTLSAGVRF